MAKSIAVILNRGSGSQTEDTRDQLARLFNEHGIDADIRVAGEGDDISQLARDAVESGVETIVAGGGDGTISAVAAEVVRSGKVLGVLPLGTLNNFSKDLEVPQELADAVAVIADGSTTAIDVGEVNGRIFINNSSLGLYPRIVRHREAQQRIGRGKWRSALWAALKVFKRSPFLKVKLALGDHELFRKTPFVFVGNNAYEMDIYNIGRRQSLSDGKLSVHLLRRGGRAALVMLVIRTLFGRLRQAKDFEELTTSEIEVTTKKSRVLVALDGEVETLDSPLTYRILPAALRVIVPAAKS
ncbi:MAG: diacylglycerol kinase family protein [Acidobacteriota bacterium]